MGRLLATIYLSTYLPMYNLVSLSLSSIPHITLPFIAVPYFPFLYTLFLFCSFYLVPSCLYKTYLSDLSDLIDLSDVIYLSGLRYLPASLSLILLRALLN